jgi:hypothetical protein
MMTVSESSGGAATERFAWHPEYRGRTVAEVRDGIRADLAHDQRAYHLAMEGAEQQEQAALASVIDLEKRWGAFNLDWAEADPDALADGVVAFELERERRQELFSYHDYRRERPTAPPARAAAGMTTGTSSPGIRWGAIIAVVIVVVVILLLLLT